jgi:hypothetical protein
MDDTTQKKLKAAGKVAWGAARIASGIATATGHGLLGAICRQHHVMHSALRYGQHSAESGLKTLKAGVAEWQDATT